MPCQALEVREWVMVWCPMSGKRAGKVDLGMYDRALPGGGSMATAEEIAGAGVDNSDAVVISLRPGTRAKPTFTYRPVNHPEWIKDESYTFELPDYAKGLEDRIFDQGPWPTFEKRDTSSCDAMVEKAKAEAKKKADAEALAQAAEDSKILPDVEGLAPAPADDVWAAEKEVLVSGSGALGCKTKLKDSWFWMVCEGKMKFTALEIEKGKRQTQTKVNVDNGAAKVLVPYVEETNMRVKLAYEGGEQFLKLKWPKGKRPFQVGTVGETR